MCLYRSDIYCILGLDYVELSVQENSSLVLFYNPQALAATLAEARNARWLARMGYPADTSQGGHAELLQRMLARLVDRAAETLATAAKDAGATLVGEVLKLDDTNESARAEAAVADFVFMFDLLHESITCPSSESVTTCQGMNLPDSCNTFFAAISSPPQHGTSMRTIVTDVMSFSRNISVSFSE